MKIGEELRVLFDYQKYKNDSMLGKVIRQVELKYDLRDESEGEGKDILKFAPVNKKNKNSPP